MAETPNGGGGGTAGGELASGVAGLSMSTPEGGITMPVLTSQFYQGPKLSCHDDLDQIALINDVLQNVSSIYVQCLLPDPGCRDITYPISSRCR